MRFLHGASHIPARINKRSGIPRSVESRALVFVIAVFAAVSRIFLGAARPFTTEKVFRASFFSPGGDSSARMLRARRDRDRGHHSRPDCLERAETPHNEIRVPVFFPGVR